MVQELSFADVWSLVSHFSIAGVARVDYFAG